MATNPYSACPICSIGANNAVHDHGAGSLGLFYSHQRPQPSWVAYLDEMTLAPGVKAVRGPIDVRHAVATQLTELLAGFEVENGVTVEEELPKPPPDLTRYDDALRSAARNCLHENAVQLIHGRQWTCDDCGRSIGRVEMRKAMVDRGVSDVDWLLE